MEDALWVRAKAEGLLGQWHMPAGEGGRGFRLMACDRHVAGDAALEERAVRLIPTTERCPVCQDVYTARVRNAG